MKRFLAAVFIATSLLAPFGVSNIAYAQDPLDSVCTGAAAQSPACRSRTTQNPLLGPTGIITRVVQVIVLATGVVAVIMIILGGFRYILSVGDSQKISSAKNTILYAVVGLVVAIFGQAIVSFVLSRL